MHWLVPVKPTVRPPTYRGYADLPRLLVLPDIGLLTHAARPMPAPTSLVFTTS